MAAPTSLLAAQMGSISRPEACLIVMAIGRQTSSICAAASAVESPEPSTSNSITSPSSGRTSSGSTSFRTFRVVRSSISQADGVIPWENTAITAWPAASALSKLANTSLLSLGRGATFSPARVMMPRVPSAPTNSRVRSYPAADLRFREPV